MSDGAKVLSGGGWTSRPLDRDEASALAKVGIKAAESQIRLNADTNRAWRIVGIGGTAIGVLGAAAAVLAVTIHDPPPPEFVRVSEETGKILVAVPSKDAPTLFTEDTSRQYLGELVERCEQYTHPLALQMSRRCAALLSPPVRSAYAEYFHGPGGPVSRHEYTGSVVASNLTYSKVASDPRHRSEHWKIYYDRTERQKNGTEECVRKVLSIQFVWRPELRMDQETRSYNPAGMQVLAYPKAEDDRGQRCRQ